MADNNCERELGQYDASNFCFESLLEDLQQFKEETGSVTIPKTHPSFISIMDTLSAAGMEELLRKRWESQLEALKDFSDQHGDCLVPVEHPTLGKWVRVQHRHYQQFSKRLPSPLTRRKYMKLGEIEGFEEFEVSKDEEKKDLVTDKSSMPNADNLTLDEKIRLKKVKSIREENTHKSSSDSAKKQLDKEAVKAQMRKKRDKGTAHRSATALKKSLIMKEIFSSSERGLQDSPDNEIDHRSASMSCVSSATRKNRDNKLHASINTLEERIQRKLLENEGEMRRGVGSRGSSGKRLSLDEEKPFDGSDPLLEASEFSVSQNSSRKNDLSSSSGKKFSRWSLAFKEKDYGDKSSQSDCVSSVMNNICFSDRWDLISKENGDILLEMTTNTSDEHKTVELYVEQLADRYSTSDFFVF